MASTSAIPIFYYVFFAIIEPLVTVVGGLGGALDPKKTYESQAPWPRGSLPPDDFPVATHVTILQLAHTCALLGVINAFVLTTCRRHLSHTPALQERIVRALLTPLVVGDTLHIAITLWALGEDRWDLSTWTPLLWITVLVGLFLFIPRVMWHLGIWRYVHSRDGGSMHLNSKLE